MDRHSRDGLRLSAQDALAIDPIIEAFKKDVDRTLLIDNLRRSYDERARRMNEFIRAREALHKARTRKVK